MVHVRRQLNARWLSKEKTVQNQTASACLLLLADELIGVLMQCKHVVRPWSLLLVGREEAS